MQVYIGSLLSFLSVAAAGRPKVPYITMNDGRQMPAIGFGTWMGFNKNGELSGEVRAMEHAVGWAIDAGYRLFDAADAYFTEDQVGRAIQRKIIQGVVKRNELFVITKVGSHFK